MSARWLPADAAPRVRNGWLLLLASLVTVGVVAIAWIYRLQREHPRRGGIDPSARVWLAVWLICLVAMIAALGLSGFGQWRNWSQASDLQQAWFVAGLAIAVLFNVWFGIGTLRLGQRLEILLSGDAPRRLATLARVALVLGIVANMAAMVIPVLAEVGAAELSVTIRRALEVFGKLGSGALLSWAMVTHGQANTLARRSLTGETAARRDGSPAREATGDGPAASAS